MLREGPAQDAGTGAAWLAFLCSVHTVDLWLTLTGVAAAYGGAWSDALDQADRALPARVEKSRPPTRTDAVLAAVDVDAVVSTVRGKFARRHIVAEARRHLLETLRGQEFTRGLDGYIAHRALSDRSRQSIVAQPGRRATLLHRRLHGARSLVDRRHRRHTAPRVVPVGAGPGRQPRRTERDPHRTPPTHRRTGRRPSRHTHRGLTPRPAVGRATRRRPPGPDTALTPAQRAAATHAHQQAAMPEEYLEGRTTDPVTWLRTPENLERLAAFTRAARDRRRAIEEGEIPAPAKARASAVRRCGPARRNGGRRCRSSSRDATGRPASGPAGRGECAGDRPLWERRPRWSTRSRRALIAEATGAPGGARRCVPAARHQAVPVTQVTAPPAPLPLTAVPRRPAEPAALHAGSPLAMSGHGGLHRAPWARTAGRVGVESTRRAESTVERIGWTPLPCAPSGGGAQDIPASGARRDSTRAPGR